MDFSFALTFFFEAGYGLVVEELASDAVWTVAVLVESLALLGLVVLVNINFLFQFVGTMCERTRVFEFTSASNLPVLADLRLVFHFETFNIFAHLLFGPELFLQL